MVSFEIRRALAVAARVLCVAAIAAPHSGWSQRGRESEQQRAIVATIDQEQAADGSYSLDLVAPLTTLSLLYQEHGDYDLAAETVERALQVVRANFGLHSLDQAALLRLLIATEQATGDFATAGKLQERLLTLAKRHPNDLRTVPILREAAERQLEVAERVLDGELPPKVTINFSYTAGGSFAEAGGGSSFMARSLALQAFNNYTAAIQVLVRNGQYASDELRELELELLRISYQQGPLYHLGRNSLRRLIGYDTASSKPWETRVHGFVQVADWDLLHSHNGMAVDLYEEVYEELKRTGVSPEFVAELFAPATPVVLPAFLPNPLVSPETDESTGFIDVAFEITKYGRGQAIEILDTTTNASKDARDDLVVLIKRSRFRPQLTDGGFDRTSPVVVRYYSNE
jgi:tetratricopeptide (TPR) repeat protein